MCFFGFSARVRLILIITRDSIMTSVSQSVLLRLVLLHCFLSLSLTAAAEGPLIGVHVAETGPEHYAERMDAANDLGIKLIRVPVDWNQLEPTQGLYNTVYVSQVKSRVAYAQSLSQRVVMMLGQSPEWAHVENGTPSYPPTEEHYQNYADAMKHIHSQLVDPTDEVQIDAATIMAWEVWNEPNAIEFWPTHNKRSADVFVLIDLAAAAEYTALLGKTYDTVKAAFPDLLILGGSLASADIDYLDAMYKAGAAGKFDHLSLHPYTRVDEEPGPNLGRSQYPDQCNESDGLAPPWCYKKGVERIRQVLDAKGDSGKQIWFTEFGTSSGAEYGDAGGKVRQQEHMKRALDILSEWFSMDDAMKIPVAIAYRLEDRVEQDNDDLFGLYNEGLSVTKPVAQEITKRVDVQGKLITCDTTTITLPHNQWSLLSLPCSVPSGVKISDLLGDDISLNGQPGIYRTHWIIYTYDSQERSYKDPGINGVLVSGQGFWFIQLSGGEVTLDLPSGSQVVSSHLPGGACQSQLGCVGLALSGATNSGIYWNLLGNPFSSNVVLDKLSVLTSSSPCGVLEEGCNLNEASDNNILSNTLWNYTAGEYKELTGAAIINSWTGFWAAELPAAAGKSPVLQVPVPSPGGP